MLYTPFICPETHQALTNKEGQLETINGNSFPMIDGIPDLTYPPRLAKFDEDVRDFYNGRVDSYENNLHLTFKTHHLDETECRKSFIKRLNLNAGERVLEIACGTGRDSELMAQQLGAEGQLFLVDIAPAMLQKCRQKLAQFPVKQEYCVASALYLPFPDNYFDATYSFGALGEFSDIKKGLAEMVRVTKTGGKVVVGDESIPLWLRETDFAKILITTNPQFAATVPLEHMPVEARDVCLQWVINNAFYLLDFRVGEGEPTADFDFEIPGQRGGSYRTRYEGQLEGVTPETKQLAYRAIASRKMSMHQWLDSVVRRAAEQELVEE